MSAADASTRSPSPPVTVFSPWKPGILPRFAEIWRYRRVIPYVGKEFILKRYRKTYLGILWIPLRPGLDLASRALLFGGFLQVSSGDRPYFIFLAFATAGWMIFEGCVRWGVRSVRIVRTLAKNVLFPRTMGVIGCVFPATLDFLLYAMVAILGTVYYLVARGENYLAPPQQMVVALAGIVLLVLFGLALGLWIAPLAEITKEIRYVMVYVMQFWYFVTPVVYPISALPAEYQGIAEYNPITAPVEMVKFGLLSTAAPTQGSLISHFAVLTVILLGGLWFFSRFERVAVARLR